MPNIEKMADTLDDLVLVATKLNALAAILIPLAQLIAKRRHEGVALPPTPLLDEILAAYDAKGDTILATNEAWFTAHGSDPSTGAPIV